MEVITTKTVKIKGHLETLLDVKKALKELGLLQGRVLECEVDVTNETIELKKETKVND